MAKKRNIESASVFERSGIRAIRVRAIEIRLYFDTAGYVKYVTFSSINIFIIGMLPNSFLQDELNVRKLQSEA